VYICPVFSHFVSAFALFCVIYATMYNYTDLTTPMNHILKLIIKNPVMMITVRSIHLYSVCKIICFDFKCDAIEGD